MLERRVNLDGRAATADVPRITVGGLRMAVFNVAAFRPLTEFKREVAEFAHYLKSTPPSEGSKGVYYPGEIEGIREQQRLRDGIEVEDATWEKMRALAREYRLDTVLDLT